MVKTLEREETTSSFAAILAHYTGVMQQWCNVLPSMESAQAAFNALPPDVQARLITRAGNYGMEVVQLMRKVPQSLWTTRTNCRSFST